MTTLDTIPAFPLPPPSPEPPTLLTLPFEIRHLILKYLLAHLTINPRVSTAISTASHTCSAPSTSGTLRLNSTTTTSTPHASPHPPPHPSLAILTTSRLLHAEALPLAIQHATLSLRTRTQNAPTGQAQHRVRIYVRIRLPISIKFPTENTLSPPSPQRDPPPRPLLAAPAQLSLRGPPRYLQRAAVSARRRD